MCIDEGTISKRFRVQVVVFEVADLRLKSYMNQTQMHTDEINVACLVVVW